MGPFRPRGYSGTKTSGTIVKLGAQVRGFRIGERVGLHHHIPCGECHACRHGVFAQCAQYKKTGITAGFEPAGGGFAEYVRVMPFVFPGVVKIPRRNSFLEGAMLEPVNTVLKGVRRLRVLAGDRVLVIGQGPIGLMFTRLLQIEGQRVMATDLFQERLTSARRMGAEWIEEGGQGDIEDRLRRHGGRAGIDGIVVTVPSNDAVLLGQRLVNPGGKVLLFAHTHPGKFASIDLSEVCLNERDLIGSYSADHSLQENVARYVFSRRIEVSRLVSHTFPLEETPRAISMAAKPSAKSLKIIVAPGMALSGG